MAVRGIICDLNGVIRDMARGVARDLEDEYGLERRLLALSLFSHNYEWRRLRLGQGDHETWLRVAHQKLEEMAGRPLPRLHQRWMQEWGPIRPNLDLIQKLSGRYRFAVLSNLHRDGVERTLNEFGVRQLFHAIADSATLEVAKPDPRAFRAAAGLLELELNECLLIDDSEENVSAARELGMAAVLYDLEKGDDLAAQLEEFGMIPEAR